MQEYNNGVEGYIKKQQAVVSIEQTVGISVISSQLSADSKFELINYLDNLLWPRLIPDF